MWKLEGDLFHLGPRCFFYALLTVTLIIPAACSHYERLKVPFTHGVDRRVRQKEVIRIDDRVYVKVPNPEGRKGETQSQYRYIPVQEYLANQESYDSVVASTPPPQEEEWSPVELETESSPPKQTLASTGQMELPLHFKKRLVIVPFRDLANPVHRKLSNSFVRSLASKIQATSDHVILFDAEVVEQALKDRVIDFDSLKSPETMELARELFNIHAMVTGTINHFFTSATESKFKAKGKTAYAIAEISAELIDTTSGKVLRLWEKRNPIFESEGKGDFSKEKAQLKAIELITSELGLEIIEELRGVRWYTTIAGVEDNRVYINAGKRSGVRIGDIFSVYPAASSEGPKGEIRVAGLFGIDSSVAVITNGNGFSANDLVRPGFQ